MKEKENVSYVITDEGKTPVSPKNGTDFELDELYAIIGCDMIEVVELNDGNIMIVDEEGKLKRNHTLNMSATILAHNKRAIGRSDYIAGKAVVCPSGYIL